MNNQISDNVNEKVCCICKGIFKGYGNNASPYKEGICCDICNEMVIQYRKNIEIEGFKNFEINVKNIYDELDDKFDYYNKNKDLIYSNSDNIIEKIKCYCSIHAKSLQSEIKKEKGADVRTKIRDDFLFEYVKMKSCNIPAFEISDEVMQLLVNTKNNIYKRNTPYENFVMLFNEYNILICGTDISVKGIIVNNKPTNKYFDYDKTSKLFDKYFDFKIILYNPDELVGETNNSHKIISVPVEKETLKIDYENVLLNQKEQYVFNKVFGDCLRLYVNFLDYLNHPKCIRTIYKLSENNQNRIKKGKSPLNDIIKIGASQDLLRIVYLNRKSKSEIKGAVEVMGHYYTFRNKGRFKKIYCMKEEELYRKGYFQRRDDMIAKWIFPFIRGDGDLLNKRRIVK